ncbi:MAG TPA: helix-turn-helix transcriptional regulator [Polyangiaceae bacterium]|nr:helix-turn-helix transcriptional regulator [Polyangiaceae bacterium]
MDDRQLLRAVGRRIAELRRQSGETQEEFSERYGATAKFIRLVEAGGENLTLITLGKFAKALRVSVAELLLPPETTRVAKGRPRGRKTSRRPRK